LDVWFDSTREIQDEGGMLVVDLPCFLDVLNVFLVFDVILTMLSAFLSAVSSPPIHSMQLEISSLHF